MYVLCHAHDMKLKQLQVLGERARFSFLANEYQFWSEESVLA